MSQNSYHSYSPEPRFSPAAYAWPPKQRLFLTMSSLIEAASVGCNVAFLTLKAGAYSDRCYG